MNFEPNHSPLLKVIDWGLIPYQEAFERQKQTVDEILRGITSEQIIFCTHPPVVTLGRGTKSGDIQSWAGDMVDVNRGGRATYHGPNQVVMYPLIYLGRSKENFKKKNFPENDLHAYLRVLEQSVIDILTQFKIQSQARTLQQQVGDDATKEATGVWIGDKKIAAIGIAIKSWVASHGVALNMWHDPQAFKGIHPCGFREDQVTDLETVLGYKVERVEIIKLWSQSMQKHLIGI